MLIFTLSVVKYQSATVWKFHGGSHMFHSDPRMRSMPNYFLSSNISFEFYAKFEVQRFLETGDVSRPGTNSM